MVDETQKFESIICKCEEAPQSKKLGQKGFKTFDHNLADALAAREKGSFFEQRKLLAIDRRVRRFTFGFRYYSVG